MRTLEWESASAAEVIAALESDIDRGLSAEQVRMRQEQYGPNVFTRQKTDSILTRVFEQFKSPLVLILLVAGIGTLLLQEFLDSIVIFIALLINVVVGTFQEERASRAFERLNESQERFAKVIRDGKEALIAAEELVPGDIVVLEGGYAVPADVRLLASKNLSLNESALTGESTPVSKSTTPVRAGVPITQQYNMAWMGTLIASGYGTGVVVETGDETEVGKIAQSLTVIDESETPMQYNVRRIARFLLIVVVIALVIIFGLGVWRGEPIGEMLLVSIAVAVAAVPSGLPAAVTIVLALGMEAILKRGGLVRSLRAAETLGSTTIILTDKTGTLTQAQLTLASIHTAISPDGGAMSGDNAEVLEMAVRSSNAFTEESREASRGLIVHGEPIEKALVLAGLEAEISQTALEERFPKRDYLEFESERQFSATLTDMPQGNSQRLFIKGAPEKLLANAAYIYKNGKKQKLTQHMRARIEDVLTAQTKDGMRLIAVGYRDVDADSVTDLGEGDEVLTGMVFGGLLAFSDPIREDVPDEIAKVRRAGARVIMLTGDNPETARSIAAMAGITKGKGEVVTGPELAQMDDTAVRTTLSKVSVFARVLPQQKLRLARILKNENEVVAMTGDGVNDAPALQSANIGVAVGSGTEVAKEAADLILINNSFAIIVAAIEEGRKIIDNLRKIIAYLLSTSFSEILLIGGALAAGAGLPILPTQILWANIVEEGFMSFAFAFEKKEPNIMKRDPRSARARTVLTGEVKRLIFIIATITGLFLLGLYFFLLWLGLPIDEIRTIMFVALSIDSIFFAFSFKSLDRPLWHINPLSNLYLLGALVISLGLLFAALTVPFLQVLLTLVPLTLFEWGMLLGIGVVNLALIEGAKYIAFRRARRSATLEA